MKTRSRFLVFLVVIAIGLFVFGSIRFLIFFSKPVPNLTAHLSRHELVTPSESNLYPDILQTKLSKEALQTWLDTDDAASSDENMVVGEIFRYLTVSILLDLPDDALVRYTHYYHLEIDNNTDRLFEDVYVKFPSVEAVEIRRTGSSAVTVRENNGRYVLGAIEPDERVDVYAWKNRPFLVQEENGIVLRHGNEPVEILFMEMVGPHSSWIKDNLLLMILLGGLVLYLTQKMFWVIRMCSGQVDPKIEKRVNLE